MNGIFYAAAAATAENAPKVSGLDQFLNVVIPIGIFVMVGFMIYKNFKEPIHDLINWIKKQTADKEEENKKVIIYQNPYLTGSEIRYE